MPVGEPLRVGAKGTDRGNQPLAERLLAVANHSRELGFRNLNGGKNGLMTR
jgi:hypothetical protein